jgi:DNA-binding MarR family transcriptional regulator
MTDNTARGGRPGDTVVQSNAASLIMTLGRRTRDRVDRDLRSHGITVRHLSALGHLHREPGISYSELARRANVTPQSMRITLQGLEDRGAVRRSSDPGRGKTATLHMTNEGHRLHEFGRNVVAEADAELLERIPPKFHQWFVDALTSALPSPS